MASVQVEIIVKTGDSHSSSERHWKLERLMTDNEDFQADHTQTTLLKLVEKVHTALDKDVVWRDQSGAGYVPRLNGKAVKNPHDR